MAYAVILALLIQIVNLQTFCTIFVLGPSLLAAFSIDVNGKQVSNKPWTGLNPVLVDVAHQME